MIRAAVAVAIIAIAFSGSAQAYSVNVTQQGNFTIDTSSFVIESVDGLPWTAGSQIDFSFKGQTHKLIEAGTIKAQFWETGVKHFTSQGNIPYFVCDNKGCDPSSPISLSLDDPANPETAFTVSFRATLPAMSSGGSPDFSMIVWGQDQDHVPYDFSLSMAYTLTM